MPDVLEHLDRLVSMANVRGGWGYCTGAPAQVEPTVLALLALATSPDAYQEPIRSGRQALDELGCPDGSFPLARGRREALWPSAAALFAQAVLNYDSATIERTASRLLGLHGKIPDDPRAAEMHDIDFRLQGWAWAENNFSWAEPTAWACLGLRRAGFGDHPRVVEGLKLLLDRAQDTGGINYGNRRIFGRLTEPIPGPTALMLLALQGQGNHPRVHAAVQYLLEDARSTDSLEHLCWSRLALDLYCQLETVAQLDERIVSAYEARLHAEWVQHSTIGEALTVLALACSERNMFRLPAGGAKAAPPANGGPVASRHFGSRVRSFFRGLAIEAAGSIRPLEALADVHIAPVTSYESDLGKIMCEQYVHFRARVPLAGKRVVLKPNLVEYHRDKVINTHPNVVAATIELCRREGAEEVIVAEGPGHWRNVEHLVQASGLGDVLSHYKIRFVDLNHDEPIKCLNLGRLTKLEYLYLAETFVRADVVISLPKLKTHHWAGATLSLKNLFGAVPGICYGWPKNELHWRGIDNSIVDIALTRTPQLTIVDAIIGMEGDGPLNGMPKPLGALVMGCDLLAVDATCCRLMQLDPQRIAYLVMGNRKRLGQLKAEAIRQLGESIESMSQPFDTLPQFHGLYLNRPA